MYSGVLITTSNDFPGAQATLLQTLTELQKSEWVSAVPPIQDLYWLTNLLENEGTDQPLPESVFYDRLAAYLGGLGVTYAQDLYCIDVNTGSRVSCLEMYNSLSRTRNANVELAATRGSYYLQVRGSCLLAQHVVYPAQCELCKGGVKMFDPRVSFELYIPALFSTFHRTWPRIAISWMPLNRPVRAWIGRTNSTPAVGHIIPLPSPTCTSFGTSTCI